MGTGGAENRRDRIRRKQEVTGGGERRKPRRRRKQEGQDNEETGGNRRWRTQEDQEEESNEPKPIIKEIKTNMNMIILIKGLSFLPQI